MCWQIQHGVLLPALREARSVGAPAVLGDTDAAAPPEGSEEQTPQLRPVAAAEPHGVSRWQSPVLSAG